MRTSIKITSAGGLKGLYGFLFIPFSEPARLIIKTQSENKKDFPCHRDPSKRDIPLSWISLFSCKHPANQHVSNSNIHA